MNKFYVYYSFDKNDANKNYVGLTKKIDNYYGGGRKLRKEANLKNFNRINLGCFDYLEEAKFWETYYINLLNPFFNIYKKSGYALNHKHISNGLKGHKLSEETKNKIRQKALGRKPSEETRLKMSLHSSLRHKSPELIEKIAAAHRGKKRNVKVNSESTRKKISDSLKKYYYNPPEIKCPYCDKKGTNIRNMKRWHFDKCKMKNGKYEYFTQ